MESIFRLIHKLGHAGIVLKAIFAALVADGLLLAFILLRRSYRKRYFAKRDARVFHFRAVWEQLISGKIPYLAWRGKIFDRRVVESLALDAQALDRFRVATRQNLGNSRLVGCDGFVHFDSTLCLWQTLFPLDSTH